MKFHTLKIFQKLACAICIQLFLGMWNIHRSKSKYFGTLLGIDIRNHLTRDTASDSRQPSFQNIPFRNSKIRRMVCAWTRNISFCIWLEICRTLQICILVFRVTPYYPVSGLFNDSDENVASILGNPEDRISESVVSKMLIAWKSEAARTHHFTVDHNPDQNMHGLVVYWFLFLLSI